MLLSASIFICSFVRTNFQHHPNASESAEVAQYLLQRARNLANGVVARGMQPAGSAKHGEAIELEIQVARWLAAASFEIRATIAATFDRLALLAVAGISVVSRPRL